MGKTLAVCILAATLVVPAPRAQAFEVDQDLMALVAMPLAVAAVSQITDVPMNDLTDLVSLLNQADVPPVQFVEVVRYVPVALVVEPEPQQPRFVEVIREREQSGVRGIDLVTFIEQRLSGYGLPTLDLTVTRPREAVNYVTYVDDDTFVPPVVRTRVAEIRTVNARQHPHGGPPGQLKKELGLQTGAEVVHGSVRHEDRRTVAAPRTVVVERHPAKVHHEKVKPAKAKKVVVYRDDAGNGRAAVAQPRAQAAPKHGGEGHGKAGGHQGGNGGGHGGGHGKGKGKG